MESELRHITLTREAALENLDEAVELTQEAQEADAPTSESDATWVGAQRIPVVPPPQHLSPPDPSSRTDVACFPMPAHKVFEDHHEFPAGDRWEAIAWSVPEGDEFPEGVTYSFQYLGPSDEELLRYDNANDAHGVGRHHRHLPDSVEGIEFEGLPTHLERFIDEVESIHEREFA